MNTNKPIIIGSKDKNSGKVSITYTYSLNESAAKEKKAELTMRLQQAQRNLVEMQEIILTLQAELAALENAVPE